MNVRRIVSALAFAACAAASLAQQAPPPPPPAQILPQMITFEEQTDDNTKMPATPLDQKVHPVDINSTIFVKVTPPAPVAAANATLSPEAQSLINAANALQAAASALSQAYTNATTLLHMGPEARTSRSPEFMAQAAIVDGHFNEFTRNVRTYIATLSASTDPELQQEAIVFRRRLDNVLEFGTPEGNTPTGFDQQRRSTPDFFEQEIVWLSNQIADHQDTTMASRVLVLAATSSHGDDTIPVALPGYSTITPGAPVRFQKINWTPTPEQVAEIDKLFAESQELAKAFNDIKDKKEDFKGVLRSLLEASGVNFAALQASLQQFVSAVNALKSTDLAQLRQDLAAGVATALAQAAPAERATIQQFQTDTGSVLTAAANLRTSIDKLVARVQSLSPKIVSANLAAQTDPVQALLLLLQTASGAVNLVTGNAQEIADIQTALTGIKPAVDKLGTDLTTTSGELDSLRPELQNSVLTALLAALKTAVSPATTALDGVVTQLQPLVRIIATLRNAPKAVSSVATSDVPPPTSVDVNALRAGDTTIALQTVNPRGNGDVVSVQAWLYELTDPNDASKRTLIETSNTGFQIGVFGWSTGPTVGVAYVTGRFEPAGQTSATRTFAPQVSWMLRYRPRTGIFSSQSLAGIGAHAISFDLDKNNQLEIGIGATVGVLNNAFYAGYGWDLTLDNENYWFLGSNLFQLATRVRDLASGGN
jgi:hypothetical protein